MNELTELRDLFADKPHPTADRLAPARTALLAEARTKRRPRARAIGLRRLMLAGGLVAAMTVGAIAVQTFNPSAPASAAEVLRLAAEAATATATPWPEPRDDQYFHYEWIAETRAENGVRNVGPRHINGEVWESVDGSRPGLLWHKPSKSVPQDRNEYKELLTRCPGRSYVSYADLRGWPADQEQLRHKLAERGNEMFPNADAATQTWHAVVSLLGRPVPPKLQAAIFEIAATLPGIETEELKDATGKSGIAVTRVRDRDRESLIFDKASYVFLGGQELVPGLGRELWSITRPQITDVLPAWSTSLKRTSCL
ncbi:CU044_5270 family protein [Microtetraspora malaysiensis]|uniref:CU044_5270 family protein n=1 Tax=Microtetraspora malaysiensis TaxID=161358 RepID=A0ABW6T1Q3_9ACTN